MDTHPSTEHGGSAGGATVLESVTDVLADLKLAAANIISSIEEAIRTPSDLRRVLGIHNQLAWSMFKLATTTNPLECSLLVPGQLSCERFAESALKKGADRHAVEQFLDARQLFEDVEKEHAGDSDTFKVILDGLAGGENESETLRQRKACFKALRWMMGVEIDLRCLTQLIWPSPEDPDTLNLLSVASTKGMRRLRSDAPLNAAILGYQHNSEQLSGADQWSLTGASDQIVGGLSLLPRFCSKPLPQFRQRPMPSQANPNYTLVEATTAELGLSSSVEFAFTTSEMGWAGRPGSGKGEGTDSFQACVKQLFPCHRFCIDVMMPNDIASAMTTKQVLANHQFATPQTLSFAGHLPQVEGVQRIRGLRSFPGLMGYPNYNELLELMFKDTGTDPTQYTLARLEVSYPPAGSYLALEHWPR